MSEVLFYHLTESKLEDALPPLLDKSLERGWRVVVQAGDAERRDALDAHLWTFREDSFLPHGTDEQAFAADQPVLLTTAPDNANAATVRFIVAPARCHLPDGLRAWGWAIQLYAVRSRESWGIGDLEDLRRLAEWSASALGAGAAVLNPLHAVLPIVPQEPSPYFPSSRRYRNPLYVRVEEVPGAWEAGLDVARLAEEPAWSR